MSCNTGTSVPLGLHFNALNFITVLYNEKVFFHGCLLVIEEMSEYCICSQNHLCGSSTYRCFLFSSTLVKKTEKVFFEIHSFLINLIFFFLLLFMMLTLFSVWGSTRPGCAPPPPLLSCFKSESAHFSDQVDFLLIKSLNEVRQHIVLCQNKNLNSESHKQPVIQTGDSD